VFEVRGSGLSIFFADAGSKNPVCWRRQSGGGDRFFSNFLYKVRTHYCFQIFLEILVGLHQLCTLLIITHHYWAFLVCSKVCFCISV